MPAGDPFLFTTPATPANWWAHWGSHLLAYGVYRLGGYNLLIAGKIATVVIGVAAPFWVAHKRGFLSWVTPFLAIVSIWASCERFLERSSLLSDVAGAWVLAILCVHRAGMSRGVWLLPVIFALWTNLHPGVQPGLGFVFAALIAAVAEAGDAVSRLAALRKWGLLMTVCTAATCLHPKGWAALGWAFSFLFETRYTVLKRHYIEFLPTFSDRFSSQSPVLAFAGLLVIVAALIAMAWWRHPARVVPWFHLLSYVGLATIGCSGVRYVTTASLPLAVLGVDLAATAGFVNLGAPLSRGPVRRRIALLLTAATASVALLASVHVARHGYRALSAPRRIGGGIDTNMHPLDVFELAHELPRSVRVFNEHQYGVLLAWLWDGDPRVFFHGYVHDAPFFVDEYLGVSRSEREFDRIVEQYDIGAFLLIPILEGRHTSLVQKLLANRPEWHLCHWDDRCMLVVRDKPETREFIAAHEIRYFNPWRVSLVDEGLRTDPDRVRREALRILRCQPTNAMARHFVTSIMRADPDTILQDR